MNIGSKQMKYLHGGSPFLLYSGLSIYYIIINTKTNRCTGDMREFPGDYRH